MHKKHSKYFSPGFTIIELLVVIVVIGILTAITTVSYAGLNQRAIKASLQSDLSSLSKQLKLYHAENSSYPTSLSAGCPIEPVSDTRSCIKTSGTNTYSNYLGTSSSFYVMLKNDTICYDISNDSPPYLNPSCTSPYIAIGSQIWHKSNLNIGTQINGSISQTNNNIVEKYCYNNIESNCTTYGGLYQWNELMQYTTAAGSQGICPTGSHVPTDNDWKVLEMQLGMSQSQADATGWRGTDQGTQLKSGGGSGLDIPLTGYRDSAGSFALPSTTFLWSSSESSANAWNHDLDSSNSAVYRATNDKSSGMSVRCLIN